MPKPKKKKKQKPRTPGGQKRGPRRSTGPKVY